MNRLASFAVLALAAALAFFALVRPASSGAQSRGDDIAMTAGPAGVWIARGDQVVICRLPLVQNQTITSPPPAPICSTPTRIP